MLLRRVARPMVSAIFIYGGIQELRAPQGQAQVAKPVLGWRGRRAAKLATTAAAAQAELLSGTISGATDAVAGVAADVTGKLTGSAKDSGGKVSGTLTGTAREAGGTVAGLAAGLAGL